MGAPKPEFPPLLPFGMHQRTVDELKAMLVDEFSTHTRRAWLWDNFLNLVDQLKAAKIKCKIWLDGSYLTEKVEPDDIDLIVEVDISILQQLTQGQRALLDDLSNLKFNTDLLKLHTFVIFSAPVVHVLGVQSAALRAQWINDWGYSLVKKEPKGIAVMEVLP